MRGWTGALFAVALLAQEPAPTGYIRASFIEYDGSAKAGELSVRTTDSRVYRFLFDDKTYFERANRRTPVTAILKGDTVEILADRGGDPGRRYARIVRVVENQPEGASAYRPRFRPSRSPTEDFIPRGNLTFAGVVRRVGKDVLILRMRTSEDKRIVLRPDTRYVHDGVEVDLPALEANTRVFIRASENFEKEIEAHQVMWGGILQPR